METLLNFINTIYPLSAELKERLTQVLQVRYLSKKDYLLKAGHICRHICFIEKGLIRCFYIKEDHEVCSWFMKEGDLIISVESFFNQTPSYESMQALEDCTLYYIHYSELEYLYRNFMELNFVSRVLLQKYYQLSEQRLYSLRMQRSYERYDYLLEHHPDLVLRVPAKYLSSYLSISEAHFSVIKAKH